MGCALARGGVLFSALRLNQSFLVQYRPSDFTTDGKLRLGFWLWLAILFLSRHLLVLVLAGLSVYVGSRSGLDMQAMRLFYSSPWLLIASLPALIVLAVALRRGSHSIALERGLWRRGRLLLALAASLDIAILVVHWYVGSIPVREWGILAVLGDGYVLAYLQRSIRVRAVFGDDGALAGPPL